MAPQQVVYIYPDVAFAVSLLMNFLILWGTARINKVGIGLWRVAGGAFCGALYSFAAAFPQGAVLQQFWMKVPFSISMVAVTFLPLGLKSFVTVTAAFYIISFALGGFFLGILYFLSTSPFYYYLTDISDLVARFFVPGLFLTILIYVVAAKFVGRTLQKRLTHSLFMVPVKVLFGNSQIEVRALIDTGNRLQDPLSRVPVMVIEYGAIKELFPAEIKNAFEKSLDPDLMLILDSVTKTSWSRRFRVIPFTSLGKENGLLIGFKPDRIDIYSEGIQVSTKDVIIGVYRQQLSPEGCYRALLHPDLLDLMTA